MDVARCDALEARSHTHASAESRVVSYQQNGDVANCPGKSSRCCTVARQRGTEYYHLRLMSFFRWHVVAFATFRKCCQSPESKRVGRLVGTQNALCVRFGRFSQLHCATRCRAKWTFQFLLSCQKLWLQWSASLCCRSMAETGSE